MSYTTPPTFVDGAVLDASDLNILGDDIAYEKGITDGLTFSAVRVTRSAATSTTSGTWLPITFTAAVFDYGSWWSSGTNIVVPAGAIPSGFTTVAIQAVLGTQFAANANGYRAIRIKLNGTEEFNSTAATFATDPSNLLTTGFIVVAAGDILTVEVYQNSGGALNASFTKVTIARFLPVA